MVLDTNHKCMKSLLRENVLKICLYLFKIYSNKKLKRANDEHKEARTIAIYMSSILPSQLPSKTLGNVSILVLKNIYTITLY